MSARNEPRLNQHKLTVFLLQENETRNPKLTEKSDRKEDDSDRLSTQDSIMKKQLQARDQTDIIKEANKIMQERNKSMGSSLLSKSKSSYDYIKDCRDINLKNYMVDLLKKERTIINDTEHKITDAIKLSEGNLNSDYKNFLRMIEDEKRTIEDKEKTYKVLRKNIDNMQERFKRKMSKNKELMENIEGKLRTITNYKFYAIFVHNVIGIHFPFGNTSNGKYENMHFDKEIETKANRIISDFDKIDQFGNIPDILDDTSLLLSKITELEDTVLKIIQKKHETEKDLKSIKENHQEELSELIIREAILKDEKDKLNIELEKEKKAKRDLNDIKVEGNKEEYLKYIQSLLKEANNSSEQETIKFTKNEKKNNSKKENRNDVKELFDILRDKENLVQLYLNELDRIREKDKDTVEEIVAYRKFKNINVNQLENKKSLEKLNQMRQIKAMERSKRIVIKGRNPMEHHMFIKGEKKVKRKVLNNKEEEEYWLIHFSDEV